MGNKKALCLAVSGVVFIKLFGLIGLLVVAGIATAIQSFSVKKDI